MTPFVASSWWKRAALPALLWLPVALAPAWAQTSQTAPTAGRQAELVPEMPPPAPPRPYRFPEAVRRTLPNGVEVYVVPGRALGGPVAPAVSIQLMIRDAGAASDPADKPGVASLAAELLTQGTERRTAQEIAEAIDFVGGTLSSGAGRDSATLRASVVKKDFELAMDLLADVALNARFDPEEIERQREQLLSSLRVDYSDGGYLASGVLRRLVFADAAYGRPAEGTPETIRSLTREDLVSFRDRHYVPQQALLGFAGDITPEEAFAAAEKYFGRWRAKAEAAAAVPAAARAPAAREGLRIVVVNKPDAVQTQIRVGARGIPRNHPDYVPLLVTNQIFGGSFNSRLSTEVRVKRGLTYNASSSFVSFLRAGAFQASTFTRTEATAEAARLVVDEIARMATGEVTADELDRARDYLAGVFLIGTETPDQVADRVLTAAFYGLPEDYNRNYPASIRAVTAEQVRAMAQRYFSAENLDVVLVGNAAAFREGLRAAFPDATVEEIPVGELDLLAPELRRVAAEAAPAQR